ncbi:hypothetical protein F5Y12DRAFT_721497 [Xylaria sp. FL1777]|nr:hypothetical protein F5Y12DRAFT_721497 [Xylaria sp. FL1777]
MTLHRHDFFWGATMAAKAAMAAMAAMAIYARATKAMMGWLGWLRRPRWVGYDGLAMMGWL